MPGGAERSPRRAVELVAKSLIWMLVRADAVALAKAMSRNRGVGHKEIANCRVLGSGLKICSYKCQAGKKFQIHSGVCQRQFPFPTVKMRTQVMARVQP